MSPRKGPDGESSVSPSPRGYTQLSPHKGIGRGEVSSSGEGLRRATDDGGARAFGKTGEGKGPEHVHFAVPRGSLAADETGGDTVAAAHAEKQAEEVTPAAAGEEKGRGEEEGGEGEGGEGEGDAEGAVSYTHLTLPTIA